MKARLRLLSVLAIFLQVLAGCTGKTQEQAPLRFAELPITYSAVTHIAQAKGFCRDQELNYFSLSVPAGPDVVASLRNTGSQGADAGGIAITPIVTMIGAGDTPVVLATILSSDQQVRLLTFSKSGITSDPKTLAGKRVGVVRNTVGDIYLSRLLAKGGLKESDLTLVNGRPADLRNLLVDGNLDAAALWDPFIVQGIRQYNAKRKDHPDADRGEPQVLVEPGLYHLTFHVVTTKDKLASHRPQLVKFLRAVVAAGDFIKSDPATAQTLLETWLGLQKGDLDDFMKTTSFEVSLDALQVKRLLGEELAWLHERQPGLKPPPSFDPYVDASLLREVAPSAVQ